MEGTTIWVKQDTKNMLEAVKDKLKLDSLDSTVRHLLSNLSSNPGEKETFAISLTVTVPPATFITLRDNFKPAPFDGILRNATIFFPPGSEDLVFVRIGVGDEALTDFIQSGDGKLLNIPLNKFVKKNTNIWAEIQNKDITFSHTPTIEIVIERAKVMVL